MDSTHGGEWSDGVQSHLANPNQDLDADASHVADAIVGHADGRAARKE